MKLRLNPEVSLEPNGPNTLAVVPESPNINLPPQIVQVVEAFREPASVAEVEGRMGLPPQHVRKISEMLQDAFILVPGDARVHPWPLPADLQQEEDDSFRAIRRVVAGYTMGRPTLGYALFEAVKHIHGAGIDGAIVESGVWRGGNIALCAMTLLGLGDTSRELYLYDTYDWSWPEFSADDVTHEVQSSAAREASVAHRRNVSAEQLKEELVSEEQVRRFVQSTGYPAEQIVTVKGLVQDTIPAEAPEEIALLRLDTDLYESTYHELVHLYPRLVSGGILLVDDYPTERGVVKAVEQYFGEHGARPFLSRIDVQGRIGIKP